MQHGDLPMASASTCLNRWGRMLASSGPFPNSSVATHGHAPQHAHGAVADGAWPASRVCACACPPRAQCPPPTTLRARPCPSSACLWWCTRVLRRTPLSASSAGTCFGCFGVFLATLDFTACCWPAFLCMRCGSFVHMHLDWFDPNCSQWSARDVTWWRGIYTLRMHGLHACVMACGGVEGCDVQTQSQQFNDLLQMEPGMS